MKPQLFIILLACFSTALLRAQVTPHFLGFDAYFQNPSHPGFGDLANSTLDATIEIRNANDEPLYRESHTSLLDAFSHVNLKVGTGDPDVGYDYDQLPWSIADYIWYSMVVHAITGDYTVEGEQDFDSDPYSILAYCSDKSNALGVNEWDERILEPASLANPSSQGFYYIPGLESSTDSHKFGRIPLSNYIRTFNAPSLIDGSSVPYMGLGTSNPCPSYFGPGNLEVASSYMSTRTGSLQHLYSGFDVTVPENTQVPDLGHATVAGSFYNTFDASGDGVYTAASNVGFYGVALNGVYGETNTPQTGSGVWGRVTTAPGAGQSKAGLLGQSLGNNNYGMMNIGRAATTNAWEVISDAQLKTNITYGNNGLDKVMQLKPATYNYVADSPYQLTSGTQHGFIAQELEKVFPEMVTEVIFPDNLDPHAANKGTQEYKAIKYNDLIPVLTSAIQELKAQVDAQAAEIAALKKELQK